MQDQAEGGGYSVTMDFQPGDMQFINNYHVLHGRSAYADDRAAGKVRHLKRLWLETEVLADRPSIFTNRMGSHWAKKASISRMDA
jgi:alpha-ketoglutarate-dependent taurine dioxygenase